MVVTGRVERGRLKVGEEMEIVGFRPTVKRVVTGIEMFRKLLDEGMAGDNVGLLLRGTEKEEVERGQVVAKPGSITPHTKFKAEAYILREEGRNDRMICQAATLDAVIVDFVAEPKLPHAREYSAGKNAVRLRESRRSGRSSGNQAMRQ